MGVIHKVRRALRGEVNARTLALEAWRRSRAAALRRRERASLDSLASAPARLAGPFARMSATELLKHFRNRTHPVLFPGCAPSSSSSHDLQRSLFPFETARLLERATRITDEHCWQVLGYGEKCFGEKIDWLVDPLSGAQWPLGFHADVQLFRRDGSDARVLWEVNRLSHLLTLGRAYAVTLDEKYAAEIFAELAAWSEQNPPGRGANWACAMEAALRVINLLAAFELTRRSAELKEDVLMDFLRIFDQHGSHIRRNLEFSYISTSNHYLSDVVGLFLLGLLLPELEAAREWRSFGLREVLREMDKQVLADGADSEASTGYHRLVLELFLYSLIAARANHLEIDERYWLRLRAMLDYVRAYLRPDGRAPLIGDTDSGQVLPLNLRAADDHSYVLAIGAALFDEPRFKLAAHDGGGAMTEELIWVLGEEGVRAFQSLDEAGEGEGSRAFTDAGTYVMRDRDLYLLFNASGNGLMGRGSHGHNDALSVEVSACHTSFIVDPGTYVYSADLSERHRFRSVAYHSTLEVDGIEQNTTDPELPFVIGDEAHPRVTLWESGPERDVVVAEHDGYMRIAQGVTHRRSVCFEKRDRLWIIEDAIKRAGEHVLRFRFHFADGLETEFLRRDEGAMVRARDEVRGAQLFVVALDLEDAPELEPRFVSRDYGQKSPSVSACWTVRGLLASPSSVFRWAIVPVCDGEDDGARLSLVARHAGKE